VRVASFLGFLATAMMAALLSVTAAYAATAPLPYTCQVLGQTRTFLVHVGTDAPTRLAFGETVAATATVTITLPEDVTTTLRDDLRAASVDGQLAAPAAVNKAKAAWALPIGRTALPAAGSSLVLVSAVPVGTFEGKRIDQKWRVRIGADLSGTLSLYRADGSAASPVPNVSIACTMTDRERALVQKVITVKDTTTTTVRGKDTVKGSRGKARITVASTHGRNPKGEVQVKVFHRGELVSERVVELEKGKAKVRTRKLLERGWSVSAKYLGSSKMRGSHGSDKIKVR
jgi:hypothetical protein